MNPISAPSPVYLGPPYHYSAGNNKPFDRLVIHCTVSDCERGGARDIAAYFRSKAAGGSAQYVVDPYEAVQAAYDSVICWGAPPNPHSLHIELCDLMAGPGKRWGNELHELMLRRAARLAAQSCLAGDLPIRRINVQDLKAGRKGICGHDDVSDAFHQSTHWDPGPAFPWPHFMRLTREAASDLLGRVSVPAPTQEDVDKEHAVPDRITRARRILRHALSAHDGIHDKRAIRRALRDLKGI